VIDNCDPIGSCVLHPRIQSVTISHDPGRGVTGKRRFNLISPPKPGHDGGRVLRALTGAMRAEQLHQHMTHMAIVIVEHHFVPLTLRRDQHG